MSIVDLLGKRMIFFDGGTGSYLQSKGLKAGEIPELWNISHKEIVVDMHKEYLKAGADVILTNTFGSNRLKFNDLNISTEQIIKASLENAREGTKEFKDAYVALDIGPLGKLLKPLGDLDFEEAYDIFKEVAIYGEKYGADLVVIETMSDLYEMKAAVLAVKENTSLPVFTTMAFDEKGKLLTGGDIKAAVALLEGLGVDALGMNCGLGPKQMVKLIDEFVEYSSLPIIVSPNAELPRTENGVAVYDIDENEFAEIMEKIAQKGAWILGGCCGTTPDYISRLFEKCHNIKPKEIVYKTKTIVSSYNQSVELGKESVIIGERINPTGKSRFKQALRENDFGYILNEAVTQQENGAQILDVNVGLPDIDEVSMMVSAVSEIQAVTGLPLQIDTTNKEAMEKAMRIYNGKPMVNSVNGKKEEMEKIFPIVKKYGGVVVALTLDESGIPETAEKRFEIAEKIVNEAAKYGINKKDIVIDVLTMTISSDNDGAKTTLKALELVRDRLEVCTVLGVSNISFGLPQREIINAFFYELALKNGLSAAILNPSNDMMMKAYYSYRALNGFDSNCMDYIKRYSKAVTTEAKTTASTDNISLQDAIIKGLKSTAHIVTKEMIKIKEPLQIINEQLIPALDVVGKGFENGTVYLPQLLMSADAAKTAFDIIKTNMLLSGQVQEKKGKIILATVKGDIHDIGKNIVKVLLENYSFEVIDLGKDVPPEKVVKTAVEQNISLIGLSALMTTTVVNMEETIKKLKQALPECKVVVGGAVLTQKYADMIGADKYAKDAMSTVYYAQKMLK